uniref:UPF0606 protein KIAA1549 isoform X3 n=1 Tax=Doryrhamphus excisus TaxID=161450 RepID=UPI0025ADA835|nr:UPF0606 protein KIAA1549 isoform X3 [Doryrhamphus excisus]
MSGLVSLVGLVAVLKKTHMNPRPQSALVLGMTLLLINLIAADSPVADVSLFGSPHHAEKFLDNIPIPRRLSLSPSRTTRTGPVNPELQYESLTPVGLDAEEPHPLLPSLHHSQMFLGSLSVSRMQPQSNVSRPSSFKKPTVSQFSFLKEVPKVSLEPEPSEIQNENKPETVLPNSHELLAPSYHVPLTGLHLASPSFQPTEAPPEYFYPSNTMDFDWGSGDYLETMAFLSPEEEDFSLVTKVPDTYDQDDDTEKYDTAFPSRVGASFSSLHHLHIRPSYSSLHYTMYVTPTISIDTIEVSNIDWSDTYSIQPTDVLLPDMNSLEYYTTQLTKDSAGSGNEDEQRGNITVVPMGTPDTTPSNSIADDTTEDDTHNSSFNVSKSFLDRSIVATSLLEPSSPILPTLISTTHRSAGTRTLGLLTEFWPDDVMPSLSLTDVQWFVTEPLPQSTIHSTPVLTATVASSSSPTDIEAVLNITSISSNGTTVPPVMLGDQGVTTDEFDNPATVILISSDTDANTTPPIPTSTDANARFHQETTGIAVNVTPVTRGGKRNTTLTSRQYLCNLDKPEYLIKIGFPLGYTLGYARSQVGEILKQQFNKSLELQVIEPPPKFAFRVVSGPVVYTAISVINALRRSGRRFLSVSPNWSVPDTKYEVHTVLQFVPPHVDVRFCNFSESIERGLGMAFAEVRRRAKASDNFIVQIINITMAVPENQQRAGRYPVDITFTVRNNRGYLMGSEVSNALMKLAKVEFSYYIGYPVFQIAEPFHYPELNTSQFLRSSWVRTVVLGVADSEVGQRTFQANIERRVAMLLGEAMGSVRRAKRATSVGNSSVQVVSMNRLTGTDHPLEVVYFVEGPDGQRIPAVKMADILNSLDVQKAAIILGYRVQGILAQPVEKGPSPPSDTENPNMWLIIGVVTPLLVVVVIISILYWKLCRTDKLEFQPDAVASMQQRQKPATSLSPPPQALHQHGRGGKCSEEEEGGFEEEEEDYDGEEEEYEEEEMKERLPRAKSKSSTPSDDDDDDEEEDKEEEERMKVFPRGRRAEEELQAPSVKGFDFAKLHLGQQSKDDVMVVQESTPTGPPKEGPSPSQNGEGATPVSKNSASSSKASRSSRRRERISPSDGDSMLSDRSSRRESTEENLRAQATPGDSKQTWKVPINVLNGPPPSSGLNEQFSSTSIFEHVDRMSRATDVSRRPPNKVQLIAMQPMSAPPLPPSLHTAAAKMADANQMNKEIQVALRQKSEMEHHRNKIRLRAKRKGHYDFPAMDDKDGGLGDAKDQDHIYQKAQMQMDKILDQNPQILMEPRKSSRGRRSPKQRIKEQSNGGKMDADKDHLISEDTDPVYRKCPGFNNVAFVSDPDQATHGSPSPTNDVFLGTPSSPPGHAPPPPPYMPPQPSIEEARQQMHSLLDDAFALVSPTSQGSSAGVTLPGVGVNTSDFSPPGRGPRSWGPSYQGIGPYTSRFSDLGVSPPLIHGPVPRQDRGLSYIPPVEAAGPGDQVQITNLYPSRGLYADELPTAARPRPVGGTAGGHLHHLTQVGLSSRMNGYPAGVRGHPGQNGGISWSNYQDDNYCRAVPDNNAMPRSVLREPTAPPSHPDPALDYLPSPLPAAPAPPTQSSASLIKAIREELLRLSQKQGSLSSYHS